MIPPTIRGARYEIEPPRRQDAKTPRRQDAKTPRLLWFLSTLILFLLGVLAVSSLAIVWPPIVGGSRRRGGHRVTGEAALSESLASKPESRPAPASAGQASARRRK